MFFAGIDTSIFEAHSTHSAVVSNAKQADIPITESTGWSAGGTFVKIYDKKVDHIKFMNAVLIV